MVTITEELLEQGMSRNGSWSYKQLKCLGTPGKKFKLEKGWRQRIIFTQITEQAAQKFLSLKNAHLDNPQPKHHKFFAKNNEKRKIKSTFNKITIYKDLLNFKHNYSLCLDLSFTYYLSTTLVVSS